MDRVIGIGEYAISNNKDDIIKTYALATCVAVAVYCPSKTASGMVHIALPFPSLSGDESIRQPGYYASTAVPFLINAMCTEFGCLKNELEISLFGGADSIRKNDVFNIGKRNLAAVKSILGEMSFRYNAEHTGGTYSRTLDMEVSTGRIKVTLNYITI